MVLSYAVFFLIYSASIIVGLLVGLILAFGWKDLSWRRALVSAKYNAVYLILLAVFPLFIQAQDLIERQFEGVGPETREIIYTNWIFSLSGSAITDLQDRLDYKIIKDVFMFIYAWLFSYLIYFAPLALLAKDDRRNLRIYAIALMFNYIILTPFYAFFPVSVSGAHPESGITPTLYVSVYWGKMVTSVDPLNNDFPSGHVSLSVSTFLVFWYGGMQYRRIAHFLLGATLAITFSVLYLGIHWPADVFGGLIVGVVAIVAARNERIQMAIDRQVRRLTDYVYKKLRRGAPSSHQARS